MITVIRNTLHPDFRLAQVRNRRRFFGRMYNLTDSSLARIERICTTKTTHRERSENRSGNTLRVGQEIFTTYS